MAGLASLFGGGGYGGNDSGVSTSSPFYNDSGIYFRSSGSGGIDAGDAVANQPRATSGGNQAVPDSTVPFGNFSGQDSGINPLYLIIGALLAVGVAVFFLFRK